MDYPALVGFLNSLESYSSDLVQELRAGVKLCHYTTLEGAIGIVQGGDLWLSHLRFSNDEEELHHGLRLVTEELDALARNLPTDAVRAAFIHNVKAAIDAQRNQPIYVCCFCEEDNLLSQWRGYADNGGGVSIEFDPQGFRRYSGEDSPFGLTRLWRVVYKDTSQRNIVRKALDYPYWPPPNDAANRARFVADALAFFLPTFKNVDFVDEKERRLIFTPDPTQPARPRFRVRAGMLVPYMSLRDMVGLKADDKRPLPIKRVLVGPGRHRQLNRESLRMALDSHGYGAVPVDASSTPYRG